MSKVNSLYKRLATKNISKKQPDFSNFNEGIKNLYKLILECDPIKEDIKLESNGYFSKLEQEMNNSKKDVLFLALRRSLKEIGSDLYLNFSEETSNVATTHANVLLNGTFDYDVLKIEFEPQKVLDVNKLEEYVKESLKESCNSESDSCITILHTDKSNFIVHAHVNDSDADTNNIGEYLKAKRSSFQIRNVIKHPILNEFMLQPKMFDVLYNNKYPDPVVWDKFNSFVKEYRGQEPYYPPLGWQRFSFNIEYFNWDLDKEWIGCKNTENEWSVGYHGIGRLGNQLKILKDILEDPSGKPKMKGGNDINSHDMCYSIDRNKRNIEGYGKSCGRGVYFTPFIEVASFYAKPIEVKEKLYQIVLKCRLNPKKLRKPIDRTHEYVMNDANYIRPYGILLKEYNGTFNYEKTWDEVVNFCNHLKEYPRET